jgi:IS1 family transposase
MNKLDVAKRAQILSCLVEGNSIRSTVRMTGAAKNTVVKLLAEVGKACAEYQDKALRNLPCKNIQCDEIWSFCYSKEKNVPAELKGTYGYGDVWTWTAICADTKLIPCWLVANRSVDAATIFMEDLASRLKNRVQLTTDGHKAYLQATENAFGGNIDYAMLVKVYGNENDSQDKSARKYSPPKCTDIKKVLISGNPNGRLVSTSFAERQNLNMRMSMRRFTRLTNAFSKKVDNLEAAVALHFMYYNFCQIHKSLRVTPAMEAGIADHVWSLEEIVKLADA